MTKQEFIEKWLVGYEDLEQKMEFESEMLSDLSSIQPDREGEINLLGQKVTIKFKNGASEAQIKIGMEEVSDQIEDYVRQKLEEQTSPCTCINESQSFCECQEVFEDYELSDVLISLPSTAEEQKARKHNSPLLQSALDEITPQEMDQTKQDMLAQEMKQHAIGMALFVGKKDLLYMNKDGSGKPLDKKGWYDVDDNYIGNDSDLYFLYTEYLKTK